MATVHKPESTPPNFLIPKFFLSNPAPKITTQHNTSPSTPPQSHTLQRSQDAEPKAMPPSQLKRLKASLHANGLTASAQQQSSKSKKRNPGRDTEQRAARAAALRTLRASLNPFEERRPARAAKRDVTSARAAAAVLGRPAVARSAGEEARRRTLRGEVERRLKVGGVVDRRGEGEGWEESVRSGRAAARRSAFDLEAEGVLTHLGRRVGGDSEERDDFDGEGLEADEDEVVRLGKRAREEGDDDVEDAEEPVRKKSKKEIMQEVIAKSKLHKFERQQARENDDVLREELDKGLGDLKASLLAFKPTQTTTEESSDKKEIYMNPDRAALLDGTADAKQDADYERKVRELALERRSQPSERTKTEEERNREETERQKQLEDERLKRMRGEEDEDISENEKADEDAVVPDPFHQPIEDDAAEFGLKPRQVLERPPGFEDDEDEFVIDDDLIASDSDGEDLGEVDGDVEIPAEILALANGHQEELSDHDDEEVEEDEGDDEDLRPAPLESKVTYQIPLSASGIQVLMENKPVNQVPEIIRRIRAQYDPSLSAANKPMLANFAQALVAYLRILSQDSPPAPLAVTEQVIRHIHSMSRTFATEIAETFRDQLDRMHKHGIADAGDLTLLTAIGTIYPTSDHFHQVVTPAITVIARWLEMTTPKTAQDFHMGAYLVALVLKYQALSKRYVPEAMRFTLLALRNGSSANVIKSHVANLRAMADLWHDKSAFIEIFTPTAVEELNRLGYIKELHHIAVLISQARLRRRPLELHHHRPLPIKSAIPKFEEGFNPGRFYDPDAERSESMRLRKEYKKERKGAMRELRKDANFLAREQLKEKKQRDQAYEEKYRKLVASVQAEEGREANEYNKEKKARKSGRR